MIGGLFWVLVPALLFLVLAALPKGRWVMPGLGAAALVLALGWALRLAGLPPLVALDAETDAGILLALVLWSGAGLLAALLQALRAVLRMRPGVHAALAAAIFAGAALFAARMAGF